MIVGLVKGRREEFGFVMVGSVRGRREEQMGLVAWVEGREDRKSTRLNSSHVD